jgi:hypothetical protein
MVAFRQKEYLLPIKFFLSIDGNFLAERVGFEPTGPFGLTGFQDRLLKPLGHLSVNAGKRKQV